MSNYIDGFALPVPKEHLDEYIAVSEAVAKILLEHGALSYQEYVGDPTEMEGTRSFHTVVDAKENEAVLYGWIVFESRESRDKVNKLVAEDPRMKDLVDPLTNPERLIFDATRMIYGGFAPLVQLGGRSDLSTY